jgi:hypothetical protein
MRAISPKPVSSDNVIEALNREIIPLLRELRRLVQLHEEAGGTVPAHALTHITGGSDEIAGDLLDIGFTPENYLQTLARLDGHLEGIDNALSPYLIYTPEPGSHAFVIGDAFTTIECTHAGAVTHTIPLNATVPYPIGTVIRFLWTGAGQPTIAAAGTLIAPAGAKVAAQNKFVFAEQKAANTWLLSGSCAT